MNILTLPSYYKDRYNKVKDVNISNFILDTKNNKINCSCISNNKHITKISFDKDVTTNSNCFVDCDCESFKFEFSYITNLNNGLLYPEKYPYLAAKQKNTLSHLSSCKHIIKFAQFIHQRSVLIINEFNKMEAKK